MALESEARMLREGVRAGLIDAEKGSAALVVYSELKKRGATFSFGEFLVERGLMTHMAMNGLERVLQDGSQDPVRTISRLDKFELLELIGEGTSGSVFRARRDPEGDLVAVKILSPSVAADPEALRRFLDEGRACVRLRHPNLVQALRVAYTEGLYYMAMELVEGGSARQLLEKSGGLLSEPQALALAEQLAAALDAAHKAGMVHRDVKPENVLLAANGQAKLADLGIAVRVDPATLAKKAPGSGTTGEFWGTSDYVAPEIIKGSGGNDPRSDLYSLGCVLYEFLTGRPPYLGATPEETFRYHLQEPVPDVRLLRPDVSLGTANLLLRLLAKGPAERFPDAQSVVLAIQLIGRMQVRGKPPASPASPPAAAVSTSPPAAAQAPAAAPRRPSKRRRAASVKAKPDRKERPARDRGGEKGSGGRRRFARGQEAKTSDRRGRGAKGRRRG